MSAEIVFLVEPDTGRVTVESSRAPNWAIQELKRELGESVSINCGRPAFSTLPNPVIGANFLEKKASSPLGAPSIYLYRLYHSSIVDGPGRRSVIQVSGCSIRCSGCYVPETHERSNGVLTPISVIVSEIVAKRKDHDGVTILGGEPFDQPEALANLVVKLKEKDFHLTIYSGYILKNLLERRDSHIDYTLSQADLLIDGPYIRELTENAGEYRGSRNQGLILQPSATRGE
jgi:anaerobic ribonucleoside-triphosphate reductase activating protein